MWSIEKEYVPAAHKISCHESTGTEPTCMVENDDSNTLWSLKERALSGDETERVCTHAITNVID